MQSYLRQAYTGLAAVVVFLIPLFFLPTTQEFYVTNKFYLLAAGVLLLLLIATIDFMLTKKITYTRTPFDKPLLFIMASYTISLIFSSPNKVQAIIALPTGLALLVLLILLYFIITNRSEDESRSESETEEPIRLLGVLSVAGFITALIVLVFSLNPFANSTLPTYLEFLKSNRFSPVGNQFDTMYFLGFLALYSGMRLFYSLTNKKSSQNTVIMHAVFGGGMLVALGIILYALFGPEGQAQAVQLPPWDVSWFAAVDTLKTLQSAVVGVGVNNFESLFTLVKPVSYNLTDLWQLNFNLSRSLLLHIWAETGLLGMLAWALLDIYIIRELHGMFMAKNPMASTLTGLGAYLFLLAFTPPSYMTLFLLFIYLMVLTHQVQKYEGIDNQTINLKKILPAWIIILIVSFSLIGVLTYLGARTYASEYYYKKSFDAVRQNNGEEVYNHLLRAIQLNPYIERYHGQFSQVNLLLANNIAQKEEISDQERQAVAQFIQQAISEAKQLVQLNPQKAAHWHNLAVIYRNIINVAEGADAWTIASYRRAILQDPNNPILRLNLGGVFYSLNNFEEAERLFEQAIAIKPDWANAYYNLAWAQFQSGKYERAIATMQNVERLVDSSSEDYKTVQENVEAFRQQSEDIEATRAGELSVPTPDSPQISPQLELPAGTGPEDTINLEPAPAPRDE